MGLHESLLVWHEVLGQQAATDPIRDCPASVLSLLPSNPESCKKLAHARIHSYEFSSVPIHWRRLFTDSSILKALEHLESLDEKSTAGPSDALASGDVFEREVEQAVRLLDMAIIVAGAPLREELIELVLQTLDTQLAYFKSNRPLKKRKVMLDRFPRRGLNIPTIDRPLEKVEDLSLHRFEERLLRGQPFVISGSLSHWPALHEHFWKSPEYLLSRTLGGRRLVPVELGRSYTDSGWSQKILTFREFMHTHMLQSTNHDDLESGCPIGYLAQHDLFAQIPSLRGDISIPDYCYTDPPRGAPNQKVAHKLEEPLLNAWFGPAGTVSPLHTDPYHNILCQVVGRKYVRLYGPNETPKLYPREKNGEGLDMSNTSQVDVEAEQGQNRAEFPLSKEASFTETILDEGDALYIPVGWWHYVRSLDVSFSVSFWWN